MRGLRVMSMSMSIELVRKYVLEAFSWFRHEWYEGSDLSYEGAQTALDIVLKALDSWPDIPRSGAWWFVYYHETNVFSYVCANCGYH